MRFQFGSLGWLDMPDCCRSEVPIPHVMYRRLTASHLSCLAPAFGSALTSALGNRNVAKENGPQESGR